MKSKLKEMLSQEKIDEAVKYLEDRMEETEKVKDQIRANSEYICWLRDLLKDDSKSIDDFDIVYKKDELEEKTYENICKLNYFYSIIQEYWTKYNISPIYIEDNFRVPVYRVFYEDFYFEICTVNYLQGYVSVRKTEDKEKAIDYKDIIADKKPEKYKEKQEFIKEFQEQIKKSKEKAEELDIDIEYLKKIVKYEFE